MVAVIHERLKESTKAGHHYSILSNCVYRLTITIGAVYYWPEIPDC